MSSKTAAAIIGYNFKMPDLSSLYSKNMLNLTLDRLVGTDPGPKNHPHQATWVNLVRLADKSLREYEAARNAFAVLQKEIHQGHISPLFLGIDHLENAITATHRAVLHSEVLRAAGWGRAVRTPTTRQKALLKAMRHHVEHAEDKLHKGQIAQGQPFMITPKERRMSFGKTTLTYLDLARCITKVYRHIEAIRGPSL